MKATVYIETSVVSYLTGRPSRDMVIAAHQELTRQWWSERSERFSLVASELVLQEASAGDAEASRSRLSVLDQMAILSASEDAILLAERLIAGGPIPREFAADALHIAIAAANGVDYLLTWNYKHLANAALRGKIEALIEKAGYAAPVICTPEELMED